MRILIGQNLTLGVTQAGVKRLAELGHPVGDLWTREVEEAYGIFKLSDGLYYLPWLSTVRHHPSLIQLFNESPDYFTGEPLQVEIPDCKYAIVYDWIEMREHVYELGGQLA